MPEILGHTLSSELDTLANSAGFREQEPPGMDIPAPPTLRFCVSDFAILALVTVAKSEVQCLEQTFLDSSEWVSLALKAEENKGRLVDGYLLLALPSKPDHPVLAEVRRIENDTTICRKHVVWPDRDGTWSNTLDAVTILGLPSATASSDAVIEPTLPYAARRALEEKESGASFYDVASTVEGLPDEEVEANEHAN